MYIKYVIALLITLVIASCSPKTAGELSVNKEFAIGFVKAKNLTEVIDFAEAQQKLVFLDFYADWCEPCKIMEKKVFYDQEVGDYFNEHFTSYKVNVEKGSGPDIAELFQVQGMPTLLFLDTRGRIVVEKMGIAYKEELMGLAESAVAKAGVVKE